jgi:metal-responsive CopG/Arc/MetJ family transcriptional regulator
MQKKTVRVPMMMEPTMVEKIDDWSFAKRIRTRAEAIRQLVRFGLEASNVETKKADATA